jgi:hypothetical protein
MYVYPNPASEILHIQLHESEQMITLYDQFGRLVIQKSIRDKTASLDVSNLSSGLYFLTSSPGNSVGKIMVKH